MHIISFITHSADLRRILDHIGVDTEPLHISPARHAGRRGAHRTMLGNQLGLAAPPAPDYEVDDQRANW